MISQTIFLFAFLLQFCWIYSQQIEPKLRNLNRDDYLKNIQRAQQVYTTGSLLQAVQTLNLFSDCKTFVDMPMLDDPETILATWNSLSSDDQHDKSVVQTFVDKYFSPPGSIELVNTIPPDLKSTLPWIESISNSSYRNLAQSLNEMWGELGRSTSPAVEANPQRFSAIRRESMFIIPGGRFREGYYWDSYWIVLGLLASEAPDTARGMIQNLLDDVETFGFAPNGGRIYYLNRSQPPVLSEMVLAWAQSPLVAPTLDPSAPLTPVALQNQAFLVSALQTLEKEYWFWMRDGPHEHCVRLKGESSPSPSPDRFLNRYYTNSSVPRPESYREDLATSLTAPLANQGTVLSDLAAAAESGWDFSGRWIGTEVDPSQPRAPAVEGVESGSGDGFSLGSIATHYILPADLNSIILRMEQNLALLHQATAPSASSPSSSSLSSSQGLPKTLRQAFLSSPDNPSLKAYGKYRGWIRGSQALSSSSLTSPQAQAYLSRAQQRAQAMWSFMWQEERARFADHWMSPEEMTYNSKRDTSDPSSSSSSSSASSSAPVESGWMFERSDVRTASIASLFFPLWAGLLQYSDPSPSARLSLQQSIFSSIQASGLVQQWGVQTTSLPNALTDQQWDSPNAWPPLQHIALEALYSLDLLPEAARLADSLAAHWLQTSLVGWEKGGMMNEKYNAMVEGARGEGGEYPPQAGFGWTNGVVLHLLKHFDME